MSDRNKHTKKHQRSKCEKTVEKIEAETYRKSVEDIVQRNRQQAAERTRLGLNAPDWYISPYKSDRARRTYTGDYVSPGKRIGKAPAR